MSQITQFNTHRILCGDSAKLPFPDDFFDLTIASPPYAKARKYGKLQFKLKGDAWLDWAMVRFMECLRVTKGLVVWVVGGTTQNYKWDALPVLLQARLHAAGVCLRNPPIFHRVGIAGSGGPDWLRADYETCISATKYRGKLPWSDNTATGKPCKYLTGGKMSHQTQDGRRKNRDLGGAQHSKQGRPEIANPGNVFHGSVGGGRMGHLAAHKNEAPYPEWLIERFVRSFCPPGGKLLDIFNGSGTAPAVTQKWGRSSVGIDIRMSQCEIARDRLIDIGATPSEIEVIDGAILDDLPEVPVLPVIPMIVEMLMPTETQVWGLPEMGDAQVVAEAESRLDSESFQPFIPSVDPYEPARSAVIGASVTPEGFFRLDTGDLTTQENGSKCFDIQDTLRAIGLEIFDPCIEHDCISGQLVPFAEEKIAA